MKYKIRPAVGEDTQAIHQLNKKYFHERGRDWHTLINSSSSEMYIMASGGKIVGFSGAMFHRWNNSARVIDIFIHPAYRKHGLGTTLVKYLLRRVRRRMVRVVIAEAPSRNKVLLLYLKCGFRICGYNDRYYNNHGREIAIFLSFELR